MNGFILVDKPLGQSSFGVIKDLNHRFSVERRFGKIGHGGTLDPFATGLLVIAIGKATRLLRFFLGSDKRYTATFKLGERSSSDDREGEIIATAPFAHIHRSDVESAMAQFIGSIMQVPPAFSAVHLDGKRAYHLARQGVDVVLPPKPVQIHHIGTVSCGLPDTPYLTLDIACSGGTYIRSIARDLGQALHSEAYLAELRRTSACHFDIEQASPLQDLLKADDLSPFLVPSLKAMSAFPVLERKEAEIIRLLRGMPVNFNISADGVYAIASRGALVAVMERKSGHNTFVRMISEGEFKQL